MRPPRDFRLIPLLLLAAAGLLAVKVLGLVLAGGDVSAEAEASASNRTISSEAVTVVAAAVPTTVPTAPPVRPRSLRMQDLFNLLDITGASESGKPGGAATKSEGTEKAKSEGAEKAKTEGASSKAAPADPTPNPGGTVIPVEEHPVSPAERAILEHLQQRRQELETRAREIEIRDNLLKEAEGRLQSRASELRDLEARINTATQKKDEADVARLKGLVVMYENMKPKDAAKIFDRLDMKILVELVTQINPRRMSDIMAQMQPDMAERLTAELAARGTGSDKGVAIENLPKIEGKPGTAGNGTEANPNGT